MVKFNFFKAYYGIQANTLRLCSNFTNELPAKCYYPSVFTSIQSMCENKSSCVLRATAATYSVTNLCSNSYPRQLFVQYQCVDSYGLSVTISKCNSNVSVPLICPATNLASVNQTTACDSSNAPMNLTCPNGNTITIVCAFYGLHPSITECTLSTNPPVCYFASSFTSVSTTCNGQQSCSIAFVNSFADPCGGLSKALVVQWKCS